MIEITGTYYDGKTSVGLPVSIRFSEQGLVDIDAADFKLSYSLATMKISPRIGNTCRSLYLADGGKLESFANNELDKIANQCKQDIYQIFAHKLENNIRYVLLSLIITTFVLWAGIEYGVPWLAKSVAYNIPVTIEQDIGKQSLATLDKSLFQASQLDNKTKQQLTQYFQQLIIELPNRQNYHLEFRYSKPLGANAFALPSGIIIITDDLVKLAENQNQIISVLGHEIAHVVYKHGLRSILQDSFTALLMAGLLGDISSVSSLAITLPIILVETRYSRQFELEADDYAVDFLKIHHINPTSLAQILERLQNNSPKLNSAFDYLSSHPATDERIKRITTREGVIR